MRCVVILGMHRSGTSALARSLHEAGLFLGGDLFNDARHDNLEGHWESRTAVAINDRLLSVSGGAWHSMPTELQADAASIPKMQAFLEELANHPAAGWKDPRTTVTWPLWRPLLPSDAHVVAAFRHPMSVARSLHVREGWPLERGLALWTAYNERLLEWTAQHSHTTWFDFDAPPDVLRADLQRIRRELGLNAAAPEQFNEFLRHHDAPADAPSSRVAQLLDALRARASAARRAPVPSAAPPSSADRIERLAKALSLQNAQQQQSARAAQAQVVQSWNHAVQLGEMGRDVAQSFEAMQTRLADLTARTEFLATKADELHGGRQHAADRLDRLERWAAGCEAALGRLRTSLPFRVYRRLRRGAPAVATAVRSAPARLAKAQFAAVRRSPTVAPSIPAVPTPNGLPGAGLQPGDPHYRAYVGPPERYDVVAAMQFNLLTSLGLRETHTLLDIGCGSLRLGRLAIPYLAEGRYCGLEPNAWLVEEGIERECGRDLVRLKRPQFCADSDFRLSAFGRTFDYMIAQSIFTHAAPAQIDRCLDEAVHCMHEGSIFVANYLAGATDYAGAEWVYPGCVTYTEDAMINRAAARGLSGTPLRTPTVNGTEWLCYRLARAPAPAAPSPAVHPHRYGKLLTLAQINAKEHRQMVGGLWDEVGRLQFDFLLSQGLRPSERLLDVGCGALRGGLHFIRYLEPGRYHGLDLNASLIQAARDVELPEAGLADKVPNLLVDDGFAVDRFGANFDYALAVSLFTHLPLNSIARCLANVAAVLKPGAKFYASFFEAPQPFHPESLSFPGGVRTHPDSDPFHYDFTTFLHLTEHLPLAAVNLGPFAHPRGQHMLQFTRL